jgi:peptide/nickel transport system substrate-binding protein
MMYALNRESMVKDIMRGLATVATGNLSPAIPDYEPNVPKYNYDSTKAKQLMAQAGWAPGADGTLVNKDGKKFEITCLLIQGDQIRGPQAELAVSNFKDVGIKMNLERLEIGTYVDRVFKAGKYDLAFYNWPYGGTDGDPDAYAQLACRGSDNKSGWCNDQATRLLEEARTTSDATKRHALYSQFQKVFAEEVPFLYVMFWDDIAFFSSKLGGLPNPQDSKYVLSLVWDLKDYWFK